MEDVAGYRVLRSAGHGDRARLLVGFDEGRTVVLKATAAGDAAAATEIEALQRAAGEHVVVLDDVSVAESGTVLVLERLSNGTLAELLERRGGLDAGEAVTILAPIAATLDRIHSLGVAHGRLSLATVCFRHDGAPTLVGFGNAQLFSAGSPEVVLETVPGVIADRAALGSVAALVLGRVGGERTAAARGLAATIGETAPGGLAARLFDLAAATPVRFDDDGGGRAVARVGEPSEPDPVEEAEAGGLPPWLAALLPSWLGERLGERLGEPIARAASVWQRLSTRRRRLALAAVAGGLTVLVAVAVVPAPSDSPVTSAATPAPAVEVDVPSALPDDPVAAATLLLELRARCLRDLSLLCLDDVVQPDSAAYADDTRLVRAVQAGGEYPPGEILAGDPVLVERLGDAALLDLPAGSSPTSVLLMKSTSGWRIRDYLDAPPPS